MVVALDLRPCGAADGFYGNALRIASTARAVLRSQLASRRHPTYIPLNALVAETGREEARERPAAHALRGRTAFRPAHPAKPFLLEHPRHPHAARHRPLDAPDEYGRNRRHRS